MRTYQPIWENLKQHKTVTIQANPSAHPRIIKAVSKEKDKDLAYRLLVAESYQRAVMRAKINGNQITFILDILPLLPSQITVGAI